MSEKPIKRYIDETIELGSYGEGWEHGNDKGYNEALDDYEQYLSQHASIEELKDIIFNFTLNYPNKTIEQHIKDKTGYCKDLAKAINKHLMEVDNDKVY